MGTIRFVIRDDKKLKDGKSPIQLVYQIKGQRKYYQTGQSVFSSNWNNDDQEAVYLDKKACKKLMPEIKPDDYLTSTEIDDLNKKLEELVSIIEKLERRFEDDGIQYGVSNVINVLKERKNKVTTKETPKNLLFDFIDHYLENHSTIRNKGSLAVYRSMKNHLQEYQKQTRVIVSFDSIDYKFFQSFQNFLIEKRGLNNTTVAKQLSTVKTFLNYARVQGINVSDRYRDFKIKKETLEVIALTNEEFEKLFYYDFTKNKKYDQVRDVFCFACVTGLRYSDLHQLKREHIKEDEIRLNVKKTKEQIVIPLNNYAKAILKKYSGQYKPLPVISNQKCNDYLKGWESKDKSGQIVKDYKGICEIAGIVDEIEIVRFRGAERVAKTYKKFELIGMHTGRKTFATLSLERGMKAEEVMSITGHKDYKSFKRYVNITEQRKKVVMQNAWGDKIKGGKLKVI